MKIKNMLQTKGTTFVELLLYISIFLVLIPILITISINSLRMDRQHNVEKQVNDDGQFVVERIYDLITQAKKVDIEIQILVIRKES